MMTNASTHERHKNSQGFTLLEMMVGIALLLVVSGAAFSSAVYFQRSYASTEAKIDTVSSMRNGMELITQEVEQAGSVDFVPVTITGAVAGNSAAAQAVTMSSAGAMYVGEILTVDTMASEENVTITAVASNNVTGIFTKSHAAGAPVDVLGVIPQGIINSGPNASTATELRMLGDFNGDGNLLYVRYICDTVGGTLTREATPINAAAKNAGVVLIDNLTVDPQGQPCFSYNTPGAIGVNTFTTNVAVQLTSRTQGVDAYTSARPTTFDILNLSPRNLVYGRSIASAGVNYGLQPLPVNSAVIP
jgi:prepilin-type N-terminal cleavage/methylation domain-containing protein